MHNHCWQAGTQLGNLDGRGVRFGFELSFGVVSSRFLRGVLHRFAREASCVMWFFLMCLECIETVAPRQHCIDLNTASAFCCLYSVQHLQPRCLEDRFLPLQKKEKPGIAKAWPLQSTFPNSGSPKCGQMTCTATVGPPRKILTRHP